METYDRLLPDQVSNWLFELEPIIKILLYDFIFEVIVIVIDCNWNKYQRDEVILWGIVYKVVLLYRYTPSVSFTNSRLTDSGRCGKCNIQRHNLQVMRVNFQIEIAASLCLLHSFHEIFKNRELCMKAYATMQLEDASVNNVINETYR